MRRRLSSAAVPVHRHSAPQVALDAGLVALAYFLAYRLRFDGAGGVPDLYQDLFLRTLGFVVIGNVAILALFGVYRHWMRYSSQSEYLRIAQATLACVLALLAYVVVVQPKLLLAPPRGLEVLGTTRELGRVLDDVEPAEVLIAIPSAPGALRAKVVAACRDRGVPV